MFLLAGVAAGAPAQGMAGQRTGAQAEIKNLLKDLRSPFLRIRERALDGLVRRGRSVLGLLTPPFPETGIQSLEKAE